MADNINAMSLEQIEERIAAIVGEYAALNLTVDSSEEDIVKAEALAAEKQELRNECGARQQRADRVKSLGETMAEEAKPAPEPESELPQTDQAEPETVPEPVAASVTPTRSPVSRAAANAPEPKVPQARPSVVVAAAADVPGFPIGQQMDGLRQVTDAIMSRMRALPKNYIAGKQDRYGVATIRREGFGDLVANGADDYDVVQRAGDEKRLAGNSLVAAGGWCAPSETLYDLCQKETLDGIASFPEFQVTRGGIRYTTGPDFSDIYNSANGFWDLTEAEAIAGTPAKTCYTVTCPPFDEVRLDAVGICVKVPILTNAGFPELVTRITEGALVAHQHKVNAKIIAFIETAAGAGITVPDQGTLAFNLDHVEWQAQAIREGYQLADGASVEVLLPTLVRPLLRAEFGRRTGVEMQTISDAQIDAWFAARNLAVQFVRDWQPLTAGHGLQAVPTTIKALMYPAGSWAKGVQDVINLDAVYDSTDLAQNIYTGLFVEEGVLAVQRCLGTTKLTIPVCVSGKTAAAVVDECMGTALTP